MGWRSPLSADSALPMLPLIFLLCQEKLILTAQGSNHMMLAIFALDLNFVSPLFVEVGSAGKKSKSPKLDCLDLSYDPKWAQMKAVKRRTWYHVDWVTIILILVDNHSQVLCSILTSSRVLILRWSHTIKPDHEAWSFQYWNRKSKSRFWSKRVMGWRKKRAPSRKD